jgi:hypothetical protein
MARALGTEMFTQRVHNLVRKSRVLKISKALYSGSGRTSGAQGSSWQL